MAENFVCIYTDADGDEASSVRMTAEVANRDIARIVKAGFVEQRNDATASRLFSHPETGETVDYIVSR